MARVNVVRAAQSAQRARLELALLDPRFAVRGEPRVARLPRTSARRSDHTISAAQTPPVPDAAAEALRRVRRSEEAARAAGHHEARHRACDRSRRRAGQMSVKRRTQDRIPSTACFRGSAEERQPQSVRLSESSATSGQVKPRCVMPVVAERGRPPTSARGEGGGRPARRHHRRFVSHVAAAFGSCPPEGGDKQGQLPRGRGVPFTEERGPNGRRTTVMEGSP